MNWVDLAIIGVLAVSALLAFLRGFVREALGVGAWVGAGLFALWAFPFAREKFRGWIGNPDIADPACMVALFVVALILLNVVAGMVGGIVRASALGGIDRTLGVVFGLLRGAALVVAAYIAAGFVVSVDRWPEPVLQARALPFAYRGAAWVADRLPAEYRPAVAPPPPGRETTSADLLRATPAGRATR